MVTVDLHQMYKPQLEPCAFDDGTLRLFNLASAVALVLSVAVEQVFAAVPPARAGKI